MKQTLKDCLERLIVRSEESASLTVGEILETLSGKNRLLLIIFLSLPFCQPLSIPGLSTPFGIVIMLLSLQYAFAKKIWLPKKILHKRMASASITKICRKSLKMMKKIRPLLHPRFGAFFKNRAMEIVNGLILCLMGLLLALPLPIPLTNLVAGWALLLIGLGLLENDGVFVLLGYLIALLTIAFFVIVLFSLEHVLIKG